MKRLVVVTIVATALVGLAASPAAAAKAKPDAFIKEDGGSFVGKKTYVPPAEVAEQTVNTNGDAPYIMRVKNRGTKTDNYTINAFPEEVPDGATRSIFYDGEDVTTEFVNAEFKVRLKSGKTSKEITIVHDLTGPGTVNTQIVVTSKKNPNRVDQVAAVAVIL